MDKRPIAAMSLPDIVPGTVPTGVPEITWLSPTELLVDESYQRTIGDKGTRLIRRIVENFDWRRFKPPTAVWTDAGLEVVDGQHSAIAAATHPAITSIPVVIVDAAAVSDRAGAFLGMNRDRLCISPMQLHAAGVVAGDENAAAIERVCAAAGVTVLRMPAQNGKYKARQTVAVRAVGDLIKRVGEGPAIEALQVLANAELAPLTATAIRAVEDLMNSAEYADLVSPEDLTQAIVALGAEADREAGVFAATHCVPRWRGLVAVWFKKAKKRRPKAVESTTPSSPQPVEKIRAKASKATQPSPPPQDAAARRAARHHAPFRDGTYG